jgi:hypothetical protein
VDSDCTDNNALTDDTCGGTPGTCQSQCLFTACTPACVSDADCDDQNAGTGDACLNPDTCAAACSNTSGIWEKLGWGALFPGMGITDGAGAGRLSIAVNNLGNPVAAWTEINDIYVKYWNGSAWASYGTSAASGGISNSGPAIASYDATIIADASGNPIVAWEEKLGGYSEIYLKRWNGANWTVMGTGSASGGGVSNTGHGSEGAELINDSTGAPILTWYEYASTGNYEIYVKRWNGAQWVEMGAGSASGGGISNLPDYSVHPAITLGADGNPIIAWSDKSTGVYQVYVKRWNGAQWMELGAGSASGGGISNALYGAGTVTLTTDGTGATIIAWNDDRNGNYTYSIFAKRWNGTSWEEIGAGSASGLGLSDSLNNSRYPSLITGASGAPVIAYNTNVAGIEQIYVKRWDGAVWEPMPLGSTTGRGVSDSDFTSSSPKIAANSAGNAFVSWSGQYRSVSPADVFVKKFNP